MSPCSFFVEQLLESLCPNSTLGTPQLLDPVVAERPSPYRSRRLCTTTPTSRRQPVRPSAPGRPHALCSARTGSSELMPRCHRYPSLSDVGGFAPYLLGARPCAFRKRRPPAFGNTPPGRGVSCQPALRAASPMEASMLSKFVFSILSITGPVTRPIGPPFGTYW